MTIALVGSGEDLPPMQPVDRELILRLGELARVVCLPTAAGKEGAERIDYWLRLGVEHFTSLGAQVESLPVIDRLSAGDPRMAEKVAAANFVYLSGGSPGYLYSTLSGTQVWDAIRSVLAAGGMLAGCSAGAMVLGEKIFSFPRWKTAFNLLPGSAIIPHFDELPAWLVRPLRWLAGSHTTLLGIEGDTALIVDGNHTEVLGVRGVTVWNKLGRVRYTHGQQPIWRDHE
jgi:cyanophycinase